MTGRLVRVRRAPPVLLPAGLATVPDLAAAAEEARRAVPGRVVRAAVGARPDLLGFPQALPDLVVQAVLKRLDSTDCTMLAQVGRPWLAAVLASGLPRLLKGRTVQL